MERLEESASREVLRRANQSLREFLAHYSGTAEGSDGEVQAMLQLERTLRAVGAELDHLQSSQSGDVRLELGLYRENLLRLRQRLGVMQTSAIECQTRLLVREKHLRAAHAWSVSARFTG